MILRSVLAATVLAALALLTGCGAPPPPDHVDADVTFARMMIPHHRQAVDMSTLAASRAGSPEVRGLAARIQQEQGPEIDRLTGMLAAWGAAPSDAGMGGMAGGGSMAGMPGMMSDADMNRLASSSGAAFDRDFLAMMIGHHTGAITMARTELDQGRNADARSLAQAIVAAQQAEITEMQGLLARR